MVHVLWLKRSLLECTLGPEFLVSIRNLYERLVFVLNMQCAIDFALYLWHLHQHHRKHCTHWIIYFHCCILLLIYYCLPELPTVVLILVNSFWVLLWYCRRSHTQLPRTLVVKRLKLHAGDKRRAKWKNYF
jgi:hypothetical protein